MPGNILIVGAKGRFGRAAITAFFDAGWNVRAFARSWENQTLPAGVGLTTGNAFDTAALANAAQGCEVIVNALNPIYTHWRRDLPRLTFSVIQAARMSGATVMLPGNVYNYGEGMPETLDEGTPHRPTSRKGRLRMEMEHSYAKAASLGMQTIILRAGDFIGRETTGNWFDSQIAAKVGEGKVMYPGPLDRVHSWAYLPDIARAMVGLAEKRGELAKFEQFGFPGFGLTGQQLIDALQRVSGRTLQINGFPWPLVRISGLFVPLMRELVEMSYLWRTSHAISGGKLAACLPDFKATPLDVAIADAIGGVRG